MPLLTGGARDAPRRQQTMRNPIVWSRNLLTPEEQALFRRAVFVGRFTLEGAEAVAGGAPDDGHAVLDGVASLLDTGSLWEEDGPGGKARFALLETVREFASERLVTSGDTEAIRDAHAV